KTPITPSGQHAHYNRQVYALGHECRSAHDLTRHNLRAARILESAAPAYLRLDNQQTQRQFANLPTKPSNNSRYALRYTYRWLPIQWPARRFRATDQQFADVARGFPPHADVRNSTDGDHLLSVLLPLRPIRLSTADTVWCTDLLAVNLKSPSSCASQGLDA